MTRPTRLIRMSPRPTAGGVVFDGHVGADVSAALTGRPPTHTSTSDPTTGDDSADGHVIGCRWINTATDEEFVATDVSVGAAVWQSTTSGGSTPEHVIDHVYNIELDYGAVGDGSTDNTAAIQAACDDIEAAGGGILYIPPGEFDYNTRIDLPTVPFTMLGASPAFVGGGSRLTYNGTATAMRRMDYATAQQWADIRFQWFTLTASSTATIGIDGKGLTRSVFEQVRINGFDASGSVALKLDGGYDATIGAWWNTISNCDISDNDTCIQLTGVAGDGQANANRILNCRIQEFTDYGIDVDIGNGNLIQGNDISSTLSNNGGIRVNDNATKIIANMFDPVGKGVHIVAGNHVFAEGNFFSGVTTAYDIDAGESHVLGPDHYESTTTKWADTSTNDAAKLNRNGEAMFAFTFATSDIPANQGATAILPTGAPATQNAVPIGRPYQVRGISVRSDGSVSSGSFTVQPTVGGSAVSGLALTVNNGSTNPANKWEGLGLGVGTATDSLRCELSSSSLSPTTLDIVVVVWIEFIIE